jgi:glucose/arabinose dehydrogenase
MNSCRARLVSVLGLFLVAGPWSHAAEPTLPTAGLRTWFQLPAGRHPTAITHAKDGSGRVFIATHCGSIYAHGGAHLSPSLFLDLSALVGCSGESGLLGLAFHPGYSQNGLFFVSYDDRQGATKLVRYKVSETSSDQADPSSAQLLLALPPEPSVHRGGDIAFGPDGFLYMSIGDHAQELRSQDLQSLHGKLLRIDVGTTDGSPYAIPPDNPFVNQPPARPEIWALGLRNPWRFAFDRLTGELFIADVGAFNHEEVNVSPAGGAGGTNYGWPRMEGPHCQPPYTACDPTGLTPPSFGYGHQDGCSITGGYRYRGATFAELEGIYFYTDWCDGRMGSARDDGGTWTSVMGASAVRSISTFGEDEAGEIYAGAYGTGLIYRLVSTVGPTILVASSSVNESAGEAVFTLSLSEPSIHSIPVNYSTSDGTAIAGRDYETRSGALEFAPGETQKEVRIRIFDDSVDEPNRQFLLVLSEPARANVGGPAPVTIVDDDPGPTVTINDCSAIEADRANDTSCTFSVRLSTASLNTVRVVYRTVDVTATANSDYQAKSGTLVFNPGWTHEYLTVYSLGDTVDESDETFLVQLTSPDGSGVIGDGDGEGRIVDDDDPPPSAPPTLIAPAGDVRTATPVFTWSAVPGATWYRLTIEAVGFGVAYENQYGCNTPTCSITPDVALPERAYEWRIQAGNRLGWGPRHPGQAFRVDLPAHRVLSFVAGGLPTSNDDGRWAFTTSTFSPMGVEVDPSGNVVFGDLSYRIRKIDATTEAVSTIAGTGQFGCDPDGGLAAATRIASPTALATDRAGNVYFAMTMSGSCSQVRKVDVATGVVTTIAGVAGSFGFSGDGGPGRDAALGGPVYGLAVDVGGNVYIADTFNRRVRRVDGASGTIAAIAGTGASGSAGDGGPAAAATFSWPGGLAVDAAGHLYVADAERHRVRRIEAGTGVITTIAGSGVAGFSGDGGPAAAARLNRPRGIAVDASGNLWIMDETNARVRFVDRVRGTITTLVGNGSGTHGPSGDGGPAAGARLWSANDVALSGGDLFISEYAAYRIRRVDNRLPYIAARPDVAIEAGEPLSLRVESSSDADGDPLTDFEWRDTAGQVVGVGATIHPVLAPGAHALTVAVRDGYGGMGSDTLQVVVNEAQPPSVSVVHPRNTSVRAGQPLVIEWTASDNGTLSRFDVYVSRDGGATLEVVCNGVDGTLRSCTWVPSIETTEALLLVQASDRAGQVSTDQVIFTIGPTVLPPDDGTGLRATYWDNKDLSGFKLARTDAAIDFDWGTGAPALGVSSNTFSVRWTGLLKPHYSETYTLYTVSDDGVRVWIDGVLVIDSWTNPVTAANQATVVLAGWRLHTIRVEYYDDRGAAKIQLLWSSVNQAREVIPQSQLYPAALHESFNDGVANGWSVVSGTWSLYTDGTPTYRSSAGASLSRAVAGDPAWRSTAVGARVKVARWGSSKSCTVGLLAHYQDPGNYYLFVYEDGELRIKKKVGGALTTLVAKPFTLTTGRWYAFTIETDESELMFSVDGAFELGVPHDTVASGKIGVIAAHADARFDDILAAPTD